MNSKTRQNIKLWMHRYGNSGLMPISDSVHVHICQCWNTHMYNMNKDLQHTTKCNKSIWVSITEKCTVVCRSLSAPGQITSCTEITHILMHNYCLFAEFNMLEKKICDLWKSFKALYIVSFIFSSMLNSTNKQKRCTQINEKYHIYVCSL